MLNEGVRLMLVPTGGFGSVIGGDLDVASGKVECLLTLGCGDEAGVGELVERGRGAGARVVAEAAARPWGHTAVLADPGRAPSGSSSRCPREPPGRRIRAWR